MKKLLSPTLLTCILLLSSSAQTPQRGAGVRIKDERGQVGAVKLYEGSHALVIGAANYRYWAKLGGVREDVPAVRAALERHGFKVEELLDPTGDDLLSRINKFINDYGLYPDNRLLIYFSGHGYTEVSGDGRKFGYVVPVDAPRPSKDVIGFQQKALTMDEIETAARRIRSKHALFVFDSCFSGTLVSRGDIQVPRVIDYYAARPVRQFITSGADNQEVPEESVFRRVFVRGLEGKADANGDGYVTGTELAAYLQDQVTYYRGEAQTPQYGKIRDPRLDAGDFIFTLPSAPARPDPGPRRGATPPFTSSAGVDLENYDQAVSDFGMAVQLDSQNVEAYTNLCAAYKNRGDLNEAIVSCNKALRLNPKYAPAYNYLGTVYYELRKYGPAIENLDEAIRLNSRYAAAYANRCAAHLDQGDPGRAVADCEKAIRLDPDHATAYNNLGVAYYRTRDYTRSIETLKRAISLDAHDGDIYASLCGAYVETGALGQAIKTCNKAIQLKPNSANAYNNLGAVYHKMRRYDDAITNLSRAVELDPRDENSHTNLGNSYLAVGNYAQAIDSFTQAIRLNPGYARAYRDRAKAHRLAGNKSQAQADEKRAEELEGAGEP